MGSDGQGVDAPTDGPPRAVFIAAVVVAVAAVGTVLAIAATREPTRAPVPIAAVPAPAAGDPSCTALMKALPKGSIYVLSGDPGDNNAKLFKAGALSEIDPYVKKGDIKILGEQAVKDWLPANALAIAENVLTQFNNKIDGFLGPNDGTAGGIIQALAGQKLAGKVPVTGQDAELAAVKRIIAGTQTMTVYKSLNLIATEAAKLSVDLIKGNKVTFKSEKAEGGVEQILLDPIVITKDNVDFLVKDGFYTKAQLGL